MSLPRFPDATKGGPITAEHVRALREAVRSLDLVLVPPLYRGPGGAICLMSKPGFWIKITGAPSGAKHPWVQVFPTSGGAWTNGAASGSTSTDSAYEQNGSTATLTNKVVRAWRDHATGEVRFQYG